MSKTKFRYNQKTLSYEKVKRSIGERVLRGFIFIAPTIVLSLIFAFFIAYRIDSPKEKALQKEILELKGEFENVQKRLELVDRVTEVIKKRDEELYRTALGASEFPEELRLMGVGGSDAYNSYKKMSNSELLIESISKLDEVERKLHAQSLSFKELVSLAKERESRLASLPAIQPVNNKELKKMASGYGWRIDPVYGTRKMHWGVDFSAPVGTDVYATGKGVVEETRVNSWGYGKEIVINHGFGYKTRYAHLSSFLVKEGDAVKRGDLIGLVGSTGKSTGSHLHYEVEKDGHKVSPIDYFHSDLTPEQYEKIVEISKNAMKSMD
ncbi:M23 family metallopeptidase [Brumimicrobium glaciale]|jgi:murein DD-endopeptidase MepM/ murein hydrolase activator NlpD|uniref:M23 family metallopeptidase n=1 Tax=Brumimicrobium glaciale TaxID=200475 RepID=A0A4Q4KKN6_9FLAO|nr:M23 family metallopeptidase [Brumimicrobium glaciale]RYM33933.1 M23 family metallopeptidase [Brumimicrobium glaciale]